MIVYVFDKHTLIIHTIINNVSFVDDNADNDGRITGEGEVAIFGLGSDYIILKNSINQSVGDVIDISNLTDERNYFLLGKEVWFHEKLERQDNQMKEQQDKMERLLQLLEVKEQ
ncbi:hypothetical protein psyc5s11_36620 [Clostridium gelidum]|uniref:Uncharacterized protein n=1 Tax=Clostridium gelidum TaxID=704125 RepID=A0ABM7T855_9CLOT|nr:hypothetical protein [Clostridium gelidum]BCZ47595.1 hypothetical protein psyc5s11_36620 [Clostridium gelidum]